MAGTEKRKISDKIDDGDEEMDSGGEEDNKPRRRAPGWILVIDGRLDHRRFVVLWQLVHHFLFIEQK